ASPRRRPVWRLVSSRPATVYPREQTKKHKAMNQPKISTKPLSGMRDFLPADIARRQHVIDIVRQIYGSYGFVPLETPAIENLSTLLGKYGEEGDQLLYRLLHRRDALQRGLDDTNYH